MFSALRRMIFPIIIIVLFFFAAMIVLQWGLDITGRNRFAAASEAMRRILVERARRKSSLAAGGEHERVDLADVEPAVEGPQLDLLALNAALEQFEVDHPRKAQLIKLRFFAGLTKRQAADVLGVSPSTVDLDWSYAKAWLRAEMGDHDGGVQ